MNKISTGLVAGVAATAMACVAVPSAFAATGVTGSCSTADANVRGSGFYSTSGSNFVWGTVVASYGGEHGPNTRLTLRLVDQSAGYKVVWSKSFTGGGSPATQHPNVPVPKGHKQYLEGLATFDISWWPDQKCNFVSNYAS